ncbi:MAG: hypothetical protein M3680_10940 [Myxococcota bacterium]|nr:hypothetical protein [Myxococcota bacterium]
MVKLNWGLILCGLVGAVVVLALPIAVVGPLEVKLLDAGGHGYLTLGCLLAAGAMGALNLFGAPTRVAAGIAIVAFLIAGMKLSGEESALVKSGTGGDVGMMLAFVGALIAIALTIKPGKQA